LNIERTVTVDRPLGSGPVPLCQSCDRTPATVERTFYDIPPIDVAGNIDETVFAVCADCAIPVAV
jgi:hypothetical protein